MSREWNPTAVPRIRLKRKVSVAVMVVDDFTGRPISDASLTVRAAQMLEPPVRKPDGYFVFLDAPTQVLDITARAWTYHPAAIRVEPGSLPQLFPVVKLRLTPNRRYRIPTDTTCLEGRAAPGAQLRVICTNDPRPMRLLYDYTLKGPMDGRLIQLYDPSASDLEGRQFALIRKTEPVPEFFMVQQLAEGEEEGACVLTAPLSKGYKKAGTTILPVYTVEADEQGDFFLPLHTPAVKVCKCRIFWESPDGSTGCQERELEPGRVTRLDLSESE